jgi:hypothetical protein
MLAQRRAVRQRLERKAAEGQGMAVAVAGRNWGIGAILGALGGLIGIIAAFVPVESVSAGPISASNSLMDGNAGKTLIVVAAIALIVAVASIMNVKMPRLVAPVVLVLCGLVALLIVGANWGNINDDVNAANQLLAGAASVGVGLYVAAVAGILMVAGGVLGFMNKG